MAIKLNASGEAHASSLIAGGHYDADSGWSFSAEDENKLLGPNGDDWSNYAKWHLAEDTDADEKTKARYKYPFGKDGKVYRRALIAIESRASQNDASPVGDAAKRLLAKLDKKDGKDDAKSSRSWFSMKSQDLNGNPVAPQIMVYDEIGGFGVSAADFDRELKSLGDVKQIDMRINSPGGDSFAGIAIHNMLAKHPATITAHIDGIAASAASLIAMAADKIVMPKNSFMVVHEPYAMTVGPADAHLKMAADLERVSNSYAQVYSDRTKQPLEDVKSLMAEDRLMPADECMSKGYADEMRDPMPMAATFELSKLPDKHREIAASLYKKEQAVEEAKVEVEQEKVENDDEAVKAKEEKRVVAIREIGEQAKMDAAFIEAAITSGASKKEFRASVIEALLGKASQQVVQESKDAGNDDAAEIAELCALVGASSAVAAEYIKAKTPVDKVRAELLAKRAKASDALEVSPVDPSSIDPKNSEARLKAWRETQAKTKREMGMLPRA